MTLDTIYNMDCLEGMKQIPDGTIDAVICDLPYGTTACAWDSVIPFDKLWEQYRRICKPNAAIVLFSQQPFTSALIVVPFADLYNPLYIRLPLNAPAYGCSALYTGSTSLSK